MRRFVVDAWLYAPAALLPAVCSVAGVIIFTRLLTTAEYGQYALIVAITGPTVMVLAQWAAQSVGRYYAEYDVAGDGQAYRTVVGTLVTLAVGGTVIVALLAWGVVAILNIDVGAPLLVLGAAALLLAQTPSTLVLPILPASLRPRPYRLAMVATAVLALAIALVATRTWGAQPAWLIWGQALASLVLLPYVLRQAHIRPRLRCWKLSAAGRQMLRRFWTYGAPMGLWMVAAGLLNVGDRYVIQWFDGSEAVGIYGANYNLVSMAFGLLNGPVITAAFPLLMRRWAEGERDGARVALARMSELYVVAAALMVAGFVVLGPWVVNLMLGPQFRAGQAIQVPVALGSALWGAATLGQKSLELTERTRLMLVDLLIAAAVNFGLNLIFVPTYGYLAAAYTTLVAFGVYTALVWWQSRSLLPWQVRGPVLAGAGATVVLAWLGSQALAGVLPGVGLAG